MTQRVSAEKVTKERFLKELQQLQNETRAVADRRYYKSSREHWGVAVPACTKLTKTLCQHLPEAELLALAKELWSNNLFDSMVCAAKILLLPKVKPSRELWETICQFLKQVDGWALEDSLAPIAWRCILADEQLLDEVELWTSHPNFWMRRAALVYTLPFAKAGRDPERMLRWAALYASDPEWFIQKAIGWWLRVLGTHNPDRVVLFLNTHWHKLKGVARREATRKLSDATVALVNKASY